MGKTISLGIHGALVILQISIKAISLKVNAMMTNKLRDKADSDRMYSDGQLYWEWGGREAYVKTTADSLGRQMFSIS